MNVDDKRNRISEIESKIQGKYNEIGRLKKEIDELIDELKKEKVSELPILVYLIRIDRTAGFENSPKYYKYEFIYYYPDLDKIDVLVQNSKYDFLPGTVDMRELFTNDSIPTETKNEGSSFYYQQFVNFVSILKIIVEDLVKNNEIDSWKDLAPYLNDFVEKNKSNKKDDEKMSLTLKNK